MVRRTVTRRPFYSSEDEPLVLYRSLSVLGCPYPVTSVLGNIFTDLLGGQTERTNLGGQSRLGTDLTTSHSQVAMKLLAAARKGNLRDSFWDVNLHDLHLIGVELGSCPMGYMLVRHIAFTKEMILTHGECERSSIVLGSCRGG